MDNGRLKMQVQDEEVVLDIWKIVQDSKHQEKCFKVEMVNDMHK